MRGMKNRIWAEIGEIAGPAITVGVNEAFSVDVVVKNTGTVAATFAVEVLTGGLAGYSWGYQFITLAAGAQGTKIWTVGPMGIPGTWDVAARVREGTVTGMILAEKNVPQEVTVVAVVAVSIVSVAARKGW